MTETGNRCPSNPPLSTKTGLEQKLSLVREEYVPERSIKKSPDSKLHLNRPVSDAQNLVGKVCDERECLDNHRCRGPEAGGAWCRDGKCSLVLAEFFYDVQGKGPHSLGICEKALEVAP